MDIRPIRTAEDLDWALSEIAPYFDDQPPLGSPEGARFEVLAALIDDYENKHFPIPAMEPIDFLRAHMENTGRAQRDLGRLLGSNSRASEILNRKRALTVDMIHRLHTEWNLPADLLVAPYHLAAA